MGQQAKQRKAKQRKLMTAAELRAWHTGYTDKSLQAAALRNGATGRQMKKRDKLEHPTRYGDGQDEAGHRIVSGRADKASGVFLNPNGANSYILPGAYAREQNRMLETGRTVPAFKNPVR